MGRHAASQSGPPWHKDSISETTPDLLNQDGSSILIFLPPLILFSTMIYFFAIGRNLAAVDSIGGILNA
ncbi:hypothetical protein BDR04DRAFT_1109748 [Suillus decipiens]|nr:hypothetical protein BDR04DRAFT_1109748 [Suillus decipiens]